MIDKVGQLTECIIKGAQEFGLGPYDKVIARVGDFGQEMEIEHVKVGRSKNGARVVILQLAAPKSPLLVGV